jgi:hypothetical protein
MSKLFKMPSPRLICFGGAKACTNAVVADNQAEDGHILGFKD